MYIKRGKYDEFTLNIGCELHVQISSKSKLFSRAANSFGRSPNKSVSLIDIATPGTLPLINETAVKKAIATGISVNGEINLFSVFDRKNYIYPDLPFGYQISQFFHPIVTGGFVNIICEDKTEKKINITRIHLEQDAGKLIHDQDKEFSFIDFNRAGVPLMEIVSEPDITSPYEAQEFVKKIRSIVRYIDASNADMEKGNLRCDANISVKKVNEKKLGNRCEIKNLNSLRSIGKAIEFEAERQISMIENGEVIRQETRLFDVETETTRLMRSKEDAMDYRYFPDPDLPPLILSNELIEKIRLSLPELPESRKNRYMSNYGLSEYDAEILISDINLSDYFEFLVKDHDAKLCVSWLTVELLGRMNKLNISFNQLSFSKNDMNSLFVLIKKKTISNKIAKDVLDEMIDSGKNPNDIIKSKGLIQISDKNILDEICKKVIHLNMDKVEEYKQGKIKLFGFFVGAVMKETKGKANPIITNQILKQLLKN